VQFADVDRVDLDLVLLLDLPVQCHAAPSLARSSLLGWLLRLELLRLGPAAEDTGYPGPGGRTCLMITC
jgi:hypothetical protein